MSDAVPNHPGVVQRMDQFVGRTMNWLYDHLRYVPRQTPVVLCDTLENRAEFPLLEARQRQEDALSRRIWHKLAGQRPFPTDAVWLRKARPAALHSHFGYTAVDDFGVHAFLDVPWLVGFYGADVYELGLTAEWKEKYATLFAKIDRALALGPQMAIALEELGCPKSKIIVHALGVDVQSLVPSDHSLRPSDPLRMLFAGTFREKKGVEYLLRGAAEARRRGVRLHLTLIGDAHTKPGDAETKAGIFQEIEKLDMSDVVTHVPFAPFDQLIAASRASHVFVAPSVTSASGDSEGTPFVMQQMMAMGIPVIATAHSDIPFVFGRHRDLLVPERDPKAIADRLQQYWETPDLLTVHGRLMRERISEAFDVRERARVLSGIYESAAERA